MDKQQLSTVLNRFGYKHLVTVYKIWLIQCAHLFLPSTCWRNRKKMFVDVQTNRHAYGRGLNFLNFFPVLLQCRRLTRLHFFKLNHVVQPSFQGGLHQVCTLLRDEVKEENVLLGHAVTKIYQVQKCD